MSGRLIVISNRIPMGDAVSGGLMVALHDALAASGGIWIGAHPEAGQADDGLEEVSTAPYQRLAFRLSEIEMHDYYLGYANSVLWPLFHRRGDLVELRPEYEAAYRRVNARLARIIRQIAGPDDLIWVHDYHFLSLAAELRAAGVQNRIGFFLHVPFPALGDLSVLTHPERFADELAQFNLVGLQTRSDVARCLEMFRADPRAEFMPDGSVKFGHRITSVRSFPIGIDTAGFAAEAEKAGPNPFGAEEPGRFILGVDRLDYSKGLPNRFKGFARYLETRTDNARACLLQIAPPSREQVPAYQEITRELEEIAGHVNGRFAELDWTPLRYIHRPIARAKLARLYRRAKACLVTSLADGMNLVAKEFVAAQNPDDPGILILSRFAGAAEDMTEALLVNPYDIEDIAKAISCALGMSHDERRRRHAACLEVVQRTDVAQWSATFLGTLTTCPYPREFSDLLQRYDKLQMRDAS
ncbi:alpha,alpha-trehalose-phosphate synthase (UDP-forming) [Paracoccus litorisediminis]|uniref:Trehalose-6-phosphate synthase n=1 Tax=Paracoccus litorisediminis TaxID=2006130 RepID=A0A844HNE5_9RHOB|nr:trehalose-6-phosphate synthase [Paracoccus litorisediminis]MTH61853.1 trehalose-6-phosphate synthase [Paracoccus litorisediminis]